MYHQSQDYMVTRIWALLALYSKLVVTILWKITVGCYMNFPTKEQRTE